MQRTSRRTAWAMAVGGALALAAAMAPKGWAHDPVEGGRLGQATLVRVAARDRTVPITERLGAVLDLLRLELEDPTPDRPSSSLYCTVSDAIQMRLMRALEEAGDVAALHAALQTVGVGSPLGKRILLAMTRGLTPEAPPWLAATVAAGVTQILLHDPEDVLRWTAAQNLADLARAHPAVMADVVPALEAALQDPCERTWLPDFGVEPGPETRKVVAHDARLALMRLGYEVVGTQACRKERYQPPVLPQPALPTGPTYIREILQRWGYRVAWDKAAGRMTAIARDGSRFSVRVGRGPEAVKDDAGRAREVAWAPAREVLVREGYSVSWSQSSQALHAERPDRSIQVRVGSRTAVVDGKPTRLKAAPRVVDGRLQIPGSFARQVAAR